MTIEMITAQVRTLNTRVEYDVNVWSEGGYVYLTLYPLRYPGDKLYPDADLEHGFPIVDTSQFYSLKIDSRSRGPQRREALEFLRNLVNEDHYENPEHYPAVLWPADEVPIEDGLDWWSSEIVLERAPELIRDFLSVLPRRNS